MDTITLAGPLEPSCARCAPPKFTQVMLTRTTSPAPGRAGRAIEAVRMSGLRVTGFQVLRDFDLSGHLHAYKVDIAKAMLSMCRALSRVLLTCSSTSSHTGELGSLAKDLQKLAMLAVPYGIRIAYEALSWGRHVNEYPQAWQIVAEADREPGARARFFPHARHGHQSRSAGRNRPRQDLSRPARRLHVARDPLARGAHRHRAAHARVPGRRRAQRDVGELVRALDRLGYRGDYSFEVFNDDYTQLPAARHRARPALGKMADGPGVAAEPAAARGRSLNASASPLRRAHRRAHALLARRRALPPRSRRGHLPSEAELAVEARLPLKEKKGLEREQGPSSPKSRQPGRGHAPVSRDAPAA